MKILTLKIQNFLTIGKAELNLDSKGLVLVQGVNKDDKSAISNGAGKSSIPDALCWGLFGTTARGVTADDVVNEVAKKDCSVTITIEDGDYLYTIARYRKSSGGGATKNGTVVYRNELADLSKPTISLDKGTEKETQEVINTIIGCDYNVFTASVYAAQEMMPDLPGMTDKMLKQLIESSSGTERLAIAFEKAKGARTVQLGACVLWSGKVGELKRNILEKQSELPDNKVLMDEWQGKLKIKVGELKKSALSMLESAKQNKADNIDTVDEKKLASDRQGVTDKIKEHGKHSQELKALRLKEKRAEHEYLAQEGYVKTLVTEYDHIKLKLTKLDDTVGKPCGACGKLYCKEDLGEVSALREAELAEFQSKRDLATPLVKSALAAFKQREQEANDFEATIPSITVLLADNDSFLKQERTLSDAKATLDYQKKTIVRFKEGIDAANKEVNPYIAIENRISASIIELGGRLVIGEREAAFAEAELVIAESVVKVFGPAGVRARILDTVTPYLNARTSDYLGALSDGNISAVWTTIQRNKAGDLREKFGIDVTNDKGAKSFKGLSGGEKRKVRLSCALALQDLVSSRATKAIKLMIADEIDDAMDEGGLERLMGVLDEKAKMGGTILIISHNSLADWCDQILTVTKEGGVSTVSGALT